LPPDDEIATAVEVVLMPANWDSGMQSHKKTSTPLLFCESAAPNFIRGGEMSISGECVQSSSLGVTESKCGGSFFS